VTTIRIYIINVLNCNNDPYLTNTSALNEVKTLNYITCELHLPHNNSINYANKINASLLNNSSSQNQRHSRYRRERERGRECECGQLDMVEISEEEDKNFL
jgi:hypothetical protein